MVVYEIYLENCICIKLEKSYKNKICKIKYQ